MEEGSLVAADGDSRLLPLQPVEAEREAMEAWQRYSSCCG